MKKLGKNIGGKEEMIGKTRSQDSREVMGSKAQEGMVSLEERNCSFSEKVVHRCNPVEN